MLINIVAQFCSALGLSLQAFRLTYISNSLQIQKFGFNIRENVRKYNLALGEFIFLVKVGKETCSCPAFDGILSLLYVHICECACQLKLE